MKTIICFSISLLMIMFLSCSKTQDEILPTEPVIIDLTAEQAGIVTNTNDFALDIFRRIAAASGEENIIISPLSISTALSMTVNGAGGTTRQAMMEALKLDGISNDVLNQSYKELIKALTTVDRRVAIKIANSVWTEKTFTARKQFIDALNNFYDAEARSFDKSDPGAAAAVNRWIEDNTSGLIKNMLDRIDPDAVMLLINAIYFKGQWQSEFNITKTSDAPFSLQDGRAIQVKMMRKEEDIKMYSGNGFRMVELPYGQGNYVMDLLLPDAADINLFIRNLNTESYNNIASNLRVVKVRLGLPRFKYAYRKSLNEILSAMGMAVAFGDNADFSGISDRQLFINRVLHQAYIETNEEGTEAAAATIVEIGVTSLPETYVINFDRPFLYIIRETTTNSIIFMGRVMNPSEG
ncbi:MAG TPA: serpin family protein [Bacteroidales bacterium]|nr:serpin family protein [Bacteroidales bacterium]